MPKLFNPEIIRRIRKWQAAPHIHPLTCATNSAHASLVPELRNAKIVLVCPTCGYVQERISKTVLKGVPPMPAVGFSRKSLEGIVKVIEGLEKKSKGTAGRSATVFIQKSTWQALLAGKDVAILRVFTKSKLHHEFGDHPERYVVKIRITRVE